ncbi:S-adenosyl-L-methionine-dependent methyltransferase [Globomyces pollinis-pini]|nr:S-adenosyl-L-methionine-dependent methyltransferase [Globomyces pollinis-pini]
MKLQSIGICIRYSILINRFYKRNTTNFFKDRHWTEREFPELRPSNTLLPNSIKLLEIGCGVGNFVFPLLKSNPALFIYCCDFSEKAIELVTTNTEYDTNRCHGFVCDLTTTDILKVIPENSLDLISAVFCLSAIPPQKLHICIENIQKLLKPGGIFLFRDYGLYDAAQLRFKPENKIDDMFYIRTDGTFSLFFTPESIQSLFPDFEVLENGYVVKEIVNRKRDLSMDRVFVQSRLRKKL